MNTKDKYKYIEEKIREVKNNNIESLIILNKLFKPLLLNLSKEIGEYNIYEDLESKFNEIIITMPLERTSKNNTTVAYINKAMRYYSWDYIKKMRRNQSILNEIIPVYELRTCDNQSIITDILEYLNPYEKEVFKFKYVYDLTLEDIGKIEHKSAQAIYKTLKKVKLILNTPEIREELFS